MKITKIRLALTGPMLPVLAILLLPASNRAAAACPGDCDRDGQVTVGELVTVVSIALDRRPLLACQDADGDADERVHIDEVVGAVSAAVDGCPDGCLPDENIMLCRQPLNIAHRGGANLAPESTIAAFDNAVEIGADVLETDIHATADGVLVCIHDDTVDRTTDGTGNVADFVYADLAALDAGYRFTPDDGATYPFRGHGVRIPTLDEVLAAYPDQYFSIEIKPNDVTLVSPLLALLDGRGMRRRVVIASFYGPPLRELRRRAPDVLTTMSLGEMATLNALTPEQEATYGAPAPIVQAPFESVTAAYMARARRLGLIIQPWTVDTRERMDALLTLGVHGIITNDPALLRQAIADVE